MDNYLDQKEKIHKNTFTVSLYNCSEEAARKYFSSFSENYDIYKSSEIMARNNIRCIELEKYFDPYYIKFMRKYNHLIKNPPEWFEIVPDEKERKISLEKEILDDELYCSSEYDIERLLALKKVLKFEWSLINKYGWELLEILASEFYRPNKIQQISSDDYQRKYAEKALTFNLAIKGYDIPLENILNSFTVVKLEDIMKDIPHKKFKKKADYISFICSLSDSTNIINKVYPIDDFFIFLPITEEIITAGLYDAINYWNYCLEATSFIFDLYYSKEEPPKLIFSGQKLKGYKNKEKEENNSTTEKSNLFKSAIRLFNKLPNQ